MVTGGKVRALQSGYRSFGGGIILFRYGIRTGLAWRRNPVNAPLGLVASLMAAHAGVVPVGHYYAAVRRNAHVRRAKPFVPASLQNINNLGRITRAALCNGVCTHHIR